MELLGNYIDGSERPAVGGAVLDVYEPATAEVFAQVAASDQRDVALAVDAARQAQPLWAATPAVERSRLLRRIAALIDRDLHALARDESRDSGKPVSLALQLDIPRASANFAFFADACTQFSSESHDTDGRALNYTLRQPAGVAACISPWNLPLYLFSWKIAPALAAGCAVVAKPSEVTPLTAHRLSRLAHEAGLPKGVLNVVHGLGTDIGPALVTHPDVHVVSFTGSTRVGADIQARTAGQFKKLSLELGGKNALVVFADADLQLAARTAARAAFLNQGQICLCGSRILVDRRVSDAFTALFLEHVSALRVGDPALPDTDQGALASLAHRDKVLQAIATARREGGQILCGGEPMQVPGRCARGWFVAPTVIAGLGPSCATNQDEIFGPVATLQAFDSDAEALALVNATRYGLMTSLWTRDLTRAHRMAAAVESGIVWVNCWLLRDLRTPFGGVKDSGLGREGGWDALRAFTEPKNICIGLT